MFMYQVGYFVIRCCMGSALVRHMHVMQNRKTHSLILHEFQFACNAIVGLGGPTRNLCFVTFGRLFCTNMYIIMGTQVRARAC